MKNKEKSEIYDDAFHVFGIDLQLTLLMEECSELTKSASKLLRGRKGVWDENENNFLNKMKLAEEIADVEIMIEQVINMFAIKCTVEEQKDKKLKRLKERIEKMRPLYERDLARKASLLGFE